VGEDGQQQWLDLLADCNPLQDDAIAEAEERGLRQALLREAMATLTDRERHIFTERRLADDPKTLEDLSEIYKVSRERIRQIEVRAFEKIRRAMFRFLEDRQLGGAPERLFA
jgi:RNA polymerase sigma-32 factor